MRGDVVGICTEFYPDMSPLARYNVEYFIRKLTSGCSQTCFSIQTTLQITEMEAVKTFHAIIINLSINNA